MHVHHAVHILESNGTMSFREYREYLISLLQRQQDVCCFNTNITAWSLNSFE